VLLLIHSEVPKLKLESRSVIVIRHQTMAVDRCTVSTRDTKGSQELETIQIKNGSSDPESSRYR